MGIFLYHGIFNLIYYNELLSNNSAVEALGYAVRVILGPLKFSFGISFFVIQQMEQEYLPALFGFLNK